MKDLIAFQGLRIGVGLVGLLPERVARLMGTAFGRLWHRLDRGRRRMAQRHMSRVIGDADAAIGAAQAVMESYGRYFAEALWVRGDRVQDLLAKTEVENLDLVLAARDAGKGMIYALPHTGNWEA